jgi:hypothetical protein
VRYPQQGKRGIAFAAFDMRSDCDVAVVAKRLNGRLFSGYLSQPQHLIATIATPFGESI